MEFCYCINPSADEPIMLVDKHIGYNEKQGYGIDGSLFQRELLMLDTMGKKRIQVWINSDGGKVLDAYNMCNAILQTKTKVDTYCYGIAASSAFNIFQMGRSRYMADYALLMAHNPYKMDGEPLTPEERVMVDAFSNSLVTLVSQRCKKTTDEVSVMMDAETWFSSSEALEQGYCDEVLASSDFNRKRMSSVSTLAARMSTASELLSTLVNQVKTENINTTNMKNVAAKLNIAESANESAFETAIDSIVNRATTAENTVATLTTTVAERDSTITDLQAQIAAFKQEKENAETAQKADAAKKFVAEHVKAGRIAAGMKAGKERDDIIAHYEKLHIADPAGTEKIVANMGINQQSPKVEINNTGTTVGSSMQAHMVAIAQKNKQL